MNTRKTNLFVTDEQLFSRGRKGDQFAISTLYNRYYQIRKQLGMLASPSCYAALDDSDAFDAFEEAFIKVLHHYSRKKSAFRTFFMKCFANTIASQIRKSKSALILFYAANMEEVIAESYEETLCLHDVIPSREVYDDPRAFFEYAEMLEELEKLPGDITPTALRLAKLVILQGYSVTDAAKKLRMKRTRASYLVHRYQAWARKVLPHREEEEKSPGDAQGLES